MRMLLISLFKLESYQLESPQTCTVNGTDGKCLFVWDCFKTEGTSLGLCKLDKSIYGSCCYHNESSNAIEDQTTPLTGLEFDYSNSGESSVASEFDGFNGLGIEADPEATTTGSEDLPSTSTPETPMKDKINVNGAPFMQTRPDSPKCGISPPSPRNISSELRIVGGENC
jgi:hypothetical protein